MIIGKMHHCLKNNVLCAAENEKMRKTHNAKRYKKKSELFFLILSFCKVISSIKNTIKKWGSNCSSEWLTEF
ncbi:hypothetical protein FACS189449_07230 [Alphaproteobacteria bacterium]|nr:hypothetical protein FACS189449_07230 [Alphaproteobacteria bacterium]